MLHQLVQLHASVHCLPAEWHEQRLVLQPPWHPHPAWLSSKICSTLPPSPIDCNNYGHQFVSTHSVYSRTCTFSAMYHVHYIVCTLAMKYCICSNVGATLILGTLWDLRDFFGSNLRHLSGHLLFLGGACFNWNVLPRANYITIPLIKSIYRASSLDVKLSCLLYLYEDLSSSNRLYTGDHPAAVAYHTN